MVRVRERNRVEDRLQKRKRNRARKLRTGNKSMI